MEGMGGDNTNNQNNSNFLSIDHSSPVEQPTPNIEATPIDIYSQQNIANTPTTPTFSSPNITSTQDAVAEEIATSEPTTQTASQVTAYEYENAFGIASDNADKDVISNAQVAPSTSDFGFHESAETPQFFNEAMEQNAAITSSGSSKASRKSRTSRKNKSDDVVVINSGNTGRSGKGRLIAIAVIALIVVVAGVAGISLLMTKSTERKADNQNVAELKKIASLIIYGEEREGDLPSMEDIRKSTPYPGGLYNDSGVFDEKMATEVMYRYKDIYSRVSVKTEKYEDYKLLDLYARQLKAIANLDKYNDEFNMIAVQSQYMNDETLIAEITKTFDAYNNDEMNNVHLESTINDLKDHSVWMTRRIFVYRDAGCINDGVIDSICRLQADTSGVDSQYSIDYYLLGAENDNSRYKIIMNALEVINRLIEE